MLNTTLEAVFSAHKKREYQARRLIRQDIKWLLLNTPNIPLAEQSTQADIHATLPLPEVTNTIRLLTVDHL